VASKEKGRETFAHVPKGSKHWLLLSQYDKSIPLRVVRTTNTASRGYLRLTMSVMLSDRPT